ncbi:MAG: hypothetical protein JWR26_3377, partial [Pedosphaera sp.]|nr:hypothetical protein [Pedosphaera sp.]
KFRGNGCHAPSKTHPETLYKLQSCVSQATNSRQPADYQTAFALPNTTEKYVDMRDPFLKQEYAILMGDPFLTRFRNTHKGSLTFRASGGLRNFACETKGKSVCLLLFNKANILS